MGINATLLSRLTSLLTFPGIILHEWSHKFFCDRLSVPVQKVCYFRLGDPPGYIIHDKVDNFGKMFLITVAPFLINTAFAFTIFVLALKMPSRTGVYFALCWLGISAAMHSPPSTQDIENLYLDARRSQKHSILALLSLPIIWLLKLLKFRDMVWVALLYAIFILILTAFLVDGATGS